VVFCGWLQVLVRQQDMQQVQPPPAEPVAPQAIEAVANITSLTSVDVSRWGTIPASLAAQQHGDHHQE
jgi:hypothetical protein